LRHAWIHSGKRGGGLNGERRQRAAARVDLFVQCLDRLPAVGDRPFGLLEIDRGIEAALVRCRTSASTSARWDSERSATSRSASRRAT